MLFYRLYPTICNIQITDPAISPQIIKVGIAPHGHHVATMLLQIIGVGMTHDDLVKLVLAFIRTEEQSFI